MKLINRDKIKLFEHLFHVLVEMSVNVNTNFYCLLIIDLVNRYDRKQTKLQLIKSSLADIISILTEKVSAPFPSAPDVSFCNGRELRRKF